MSSSRSRWEAAHQGRFREAVCAFANDLPDDRRPGVVFVGVRDDGTSTGLTVTDDMLIRLANMKTDGNIVPPPSITVRKLLLLWRGSCSGHGSAIRLAAGALLKAGSMSGSALEEVSPLHRMKEFSTKRGATGTFLSTYSLSHPPHWRTLICFSSATNTCLRPSLRMFWRQTTAVLRSSSLLRR